MQYTTVRCHTEILVANTYLSQRTHSIKETLKINKNVLFALFIHIKVRKARNECLFIV